MKDAVALPPKYTPEVIADMRLTKSGRKKLWNIISYYRKNPYNPPIKMTDDQLRENHKAANRRWRQNNPDYFNEYYEQNPDVVKRAKRKWKQRNPGKVKSDTMARIEKIRVATPPWADRRMIDLVYIEADRLQGETGIRQAVDHIVPIRGKNVCGLHVHWNLRIITNSENAKKNNKFNGPWDAFEPGRMPVKYYSDYDLERIVRGEFTHTKPL